MSVRSRHEQDIEEAYRIQVKAGVQGAIRSTAVGLGLAIIANYTWPFFRRQTLAFKGFIITGFTVFGLTLSAEQALLAYEAKKRMEENGIRREARIALARRGLIGTETEIAKWRDEQDEAAVTKAQYQTPSSMSARDFH